MSSTPKPVHYSPGNTPQSRFLGKASPLSALLWTPPPALGGEGGAARGLQLPGSSGFAVKTEGLNNTNPLGFTLAFGPSSPGPKFRSYLCLNCCGLPAFLTSPSSFPPYPFIHPPFLAPIVLLLKQPLLALFCLRISLNGSALLRAEGKTQMPKVRTLSGGRSLAGSLREAQKHTHTIHVLNGVSDPWRAHHPLKG